MELELSARVKMPTGPAVLTNNRTGFALGLWATRPVGRWAPFASVTYRMLGDRNALRLRDGFAASAGTSFYAANSDEAAPSFREDRAPLFRDDVAPSETGPYWH